MPSMASFFYICDYLGVSPDEFFSYNLKDPVKTRETYDLICDLNERQHNLVQSLLIEITKHK